MGAPLEPQPSLHDAAFRRAVLAVMLLNLAYFGVECVVALRIGSVALFADAIDFLEDAAANLLILLASGWSMRRRVRVGFVLAALMLLPALTALWMASQKLRHPVAPEPVALTLVGLGALAVNLLAAALVARFRHREGSLTRAAFLSARNDALANLGIIGAGLVTAFLWRTAWPDLIVGVVIAALNADAAREVLTRARREGRGLTPP